MPSSGDAANGFGANQGDADGEWVRFDEPRETFLAQGNKKRILGQAHGRGAILADTVLTRDELFDALDADGNGTLTRDEVPW